MALKKFVVITLILLFNTSVLSDTSYIIKEPRLVYTERVASTNAIWKATNHDVRKFKSIDYISLYDALDYYGYNQPNQKLALEDLLHLSKMIPQEQSLQEFYKKKTGNSAVLQDLLSLVEYLQKHFVVRTGNKERWELSEAPLWSHKKEQQIVNDARILGFIDNTLPTISHVDAICILGANKKTMENRINYAVRLISEGLLSAKYIILLAGERYVEVVVDGSQEELQNIANYYGIKNIKSLTETNLIKYIYEHSSLYNKFPMLVIDTPKGMLPRPTTETTVIKLLDTIKQYPDIHTIAFISNQPYISYQDAIIEKTINNTTSQITKFEVIGDELNLHSPAMSPIAKSELKNTEQLTNRTMILLIEAIGSYMFAKTPTVINKLDIQPSDINPVILEKLYNLYSKNKLVYHNILILFNPKLINKQ